MDIVLIRHGLAAPGGDDHLRPLTVEGVQITQQIAKNLQGHLPPAGFIVDSGLVRAVQTADLFHNVFPAAERLEFESLRPGSSAPDLIAELQKISADAVVFLVGHEPLMGRYASYMLGGNQASFCAFKKSGVMWIEFDGPAKGGQGNLRCYLPPSLAKHVAPK